ncbi:MAG: peptidylprolyl isomerase [Candidatus Levybacteria bacterium RBG_16_35_6]|nr:MAG: peptidylprolyl isomerase [Candidatus Levybacteria bacterium RBG_16_35_6]
MTNLKIEDLKLGTGASVKEGDTIAVNYKGMLINGSVFDSTQGRQPLSTQIGAGKVIKGWDEGLLGMKVGGLRRLTIPPSLGYGDQNVGDIPPNSVLIFDIELIRIEEEPSPTASPSSAP